MKMQQGNASGTASQNFSRAMQLKGLVTFGFVMLLISFFVPWIAASASLPFYGQYAQSRTGYEVLNEIFDSTYSTIGRLIVWFILLSAIVGPIVTWASRSLDAGGVVCILFGLVDGLFAFNIYNDLQSAVAGANASVHAQISLGFYLFPLGAIIVFVGGILLATTKKQPIGHTPLPPPPPPSR